MNDFLHRVLPKASAERHALVLGELHGQDAPVVALGARLPALAKEHDVGTLAVELPVWLAPLIWAAEQSHDPQQRSEWLALLQPVRLPIGALAQQAIDAGIAVVPYDMRVTNLREHFHYAVRPGSLMHPDMVLYQYNAVQEVLAANPQIAKRYEEWMQKIAAHRTSDAPYDAQSAAFLAGEAGVRHLLVLNGHAHNNGTRQSFFGVDGHLPSLLGEQGFVVSTAKISANPALDVIARRFAPGGDLWRGLQHFCVEDVDMPIWLADSNQFMSVETPANSSTELRPIAEAFKAAGVMIDCDGASAPLPEAQIRIIMPSTGRAQTPY